ncbi:outer membrane lipoprotein-sorting protein [Arthrobacter pigmenti]|uniref:Outer membrane lipoprotein-sorting protein n=1 Tax=Arthrobacter pigmenti TaxID=271432 RepID=A0A846RQE5_9MICC|nr:hypothetical protein [Arthrobacter pigmenti]NJC21326.1 outer membrane lipoprotein-sorting protein [Arthrobacter pigmenti]
MSKSRLLLLLLLCMVTLVTTGCFGESREDRYAEAIASIEGVDSQSVSYSNHAGMSSTTRIEIATSTNDSQELLRILEDSLKAFAAETDDESTDLSYVVYSQDRSVYVTPSDLSPDLDFLNDIRNYFDL